MSGRRTGARRPRRHAGLIGSIAVVALLALAAYALVQGPRGAEVFATRTDPDRTLRVEFLKATNAQRWLHPSMDIPGTARLVRVADGAVVARSGVVDFFGGGNAAVLWPVGGERTVQVGRDITLTVPPAPR